MTYIDDWRSVLGLNVPCMNERAVFADKIKQDGSESHEQGLYSRSALVDVRHLRESSYVSCSYQDYKMSASVFSFSFRNIG